MHLTAKARVGKTSMMTTLVVQRVTLHLSDVTQVKPLSLKLCVRAVLRMTMRVVLLRNRCMIGVGAPVSITTDLRVRSAPSMPVVRATLRAVCYASSLGKHIVTMS